MAFHQRLDPGWEENFIRNIGYGTDENLFPRAHRLSFEEARDIL